MVLFRWSWGDGKCGDRSVWKREWISLLFGIDCKNFFY